MKRGFAYLGVIIIWSTSPLAVKWSSEGMSFMDALVARVLIALILSCGLLLLTGRALVSHKSDWRAFAAGLLGIFPTSLLVYWSAQFISSGIAAIVFGIYPFAVGLFTWVFMGENIFNTRRVLALIMALTGLVIVNLAQLRFGFDALLGVFGMSISALLFSFSTVMVKKVGAQLDPLRQSTGVLLLAAPLLVVIWLSSGSSFPISIDARAGWSVVYSAVAGTCIGGILFFYVLRHFQVATVGLIPLITPVTAVLVGAQWNNESLSVYSLVGSVFILLSLGLYQEPASWRRVRENMIDALAVLKKWNKEWSSKKNDTPVKSL